MIPSESLTTDRKGGFFLPLRFSGGINTALPIQMIDAEECAAGSENFDLGLDSPRYRPRPPFDLFGTAPNALEIRGFVELIKSDGTVSNLIQAGGNVYQYDGTTWTLVGTCNASSRLRGTRYSTSKLDDKVLIADLELLTVVHTWDGTTFEPLTTDLGTNFYAKYIVVDRERAIYGAVRTSITTEHVILSSADTASISASALGTLTTANRPSSSLGAGDAWYLPMPDLSPVNGLISAFGNLFISTEEGSIYQLAGNDSKDFALSKLNATAAPSGRESVVFVGNDILYGRAGAIESLIATDAYGDVEVDDVSRWISPTVKDVQGWTLVYNPRTHKVYCWPDNGNEVWALDKSLYDSAMRASRSTTSTKSLSPWSKYTTDYGNGDFRQTAAMLVRRPQDRLDMILFGDADGNVFQMEGAGVQDGGTTDIAVVRVSALIRAPWRGKGQNVGSTLSDVRGYVLYRKQFASTLTLKGLYAGVYLGDEEKTLSITAFSGIDVYGGAVYYGGAFYYGTQFEGRLERKEWDLPSHSDGFQLSAAITGTEFDIDEIGIQFAA